VNQVFPHVIIFTLIIFSICFSYTTTHWPYRWWSFASYLIQ